MDFRQLEAFLAVVDSGSFSQAGKVLHTAQSNISTRVKNLEADLGVTLIDRDTMEPTPEGRSVLERARRILHEEEAISTDVKSMADALVSLSNFAVGDGARCSEIDVNPLMLKVAGVTAVDALVVMDGQTVAQ